tara:strand:+ start:6644 stop:7009 length:366 start_codon:yes stop_codon:yes gene_type:complete
MHAGVHSAPFGGVGESGYGYYHGRHGFDCFTHKRVIVAPPTWLERLMGFRYPPYSINNIGKLTVKNKIGFRKGETMEDQRVGKRSSKMIPVGLIVAVLFVVATWQDPSLLARVSSLAYHKT